MPMPITERGANIRLLTMILENPAGYSVSCGGLTVMRDSSGIGWRLAGEPARHIDHTYSVAKDAATAFTILRWNGQLGLDGGGVEVTTRKNDKVITEARDWYTTGQAAAFLDIPGRTFRRYVNQGKIVGTQHPVTGRWRISHAKLVEFMDAYGLRSNEQ